MPNLKLKYQPLDSLEVTSEFERLRRIVKDDGSVVTRPHRGLDLRARTPINLYNAHDGDVIFSGESDSFGNAIIIQDRDSGYSTLYAHLSSIDQSVASVGQFVSGKTLIGITGKTGPAGTQYHLHMEVINENVSNEIKKGTDLGDPEKVKGKGRDVNPRLLFAEAFPDSFPTAVDSKDGGYDITGDYRGNLLKGNLLSNYVEGLEGFDTYYFPTLSGADEVIDSDFDGIIQIGNYVLAGGASPKTDKNNQVIPNAWRRGLYDLSRSTSGTDLVITKANSDISNSKTGSITIQNFPFENEHGAFGITLGKTADLALDENGNVISTTGYDLVDKALPSNQYLLGGPFIKTERDFSGVMLQRDGGSYTDRMLLGRFNYYGDKIGQQNLNDDVPVASVGAPAQYVDPTSGKVFTAVTFSSRYFFSSSLGEISTDPEQRAAGDLYQFNVGIAIIDDSGKRIKSQIIASAIGPKSVGRAFLLQQPGRSDDDLVNPEHIDQEFFSFTYNGPSSSAASQRFLQKLDLTTLEKIGEPIAITGNFAIQWTHPNTLKFSNGNRVTIQTEVAQVAHVELPKLRELHSNEIIPNYDLTSGKQNTDPNAKKAVVAFQPSVDAELGITLNPNSVLAVLGLDSNPSAKMSFPVQDRSQTRIYSTDSGQYSLEDLLAGKFDPSLFQALTLPRRLSAEEQAQVKSDAEIMKEWESAFTPEEMRKLATTKFDILNGTFSNSTDDAYGYYLGDDAATNDDAIDETILEDVAQPYTVIVLPNNQTVILVGVNATEVAKIPEVYFLTAAEITQSPSGRPSSQPSAVPSSDPIALPSAAPTHNPIAGDLIMPSSLPSGLPSSQPSGWPSSDPTQDPTNNPSSEPTQKPSLRKYAPSAIPSFVATERNTNSPSSQPSQIPWQKPTARPSQKPTELVSLDDSAIPTSRPTWNPTTNNPSSNPSSISPAPSAATTVISTPDVTESQTQFQTPLQTPFQTQIQTPSLTNQLTDPSNSKPSNQMSATEIGLITGGTVALVGLALGAAYKFLTRGGQKQSTVHPKASDYREEDVERNSGNRAGGKAR